MEIFLAYIVQYWWLIFVFIGLWIAVKKMHIGFGGEAVEIGAQQAKQLIDQRHALLIDLAEKRTFDKAHIPGAVNMPGISFIDGTAVFDDVSKPVILLPMKGLIPMPVVQFLLAEGVSELYFFKGGLSEWQADQKT